MEGQKLMQNSNVQRRFQKFLRASEFTALSLRSIILGILINFAFIDVGLFYLLKPSINHGQLPWYTTDILVISIGCLEAICALFWSWFGNRRLRTMTIAVTALGLSCLILFGLPSVPIGIGSEYCTIGPTPRIFFAGMTTAASGRLALIIIVSIINLVTKGAVWSHSVILLDQTDSGSMSMHFGVMLLARTLPMLIAPLLLSENSDMWLVVGIPIINFLISAFRLYRLPEPETEEEYESRNYFLLTLARVLSNGPAAAVIIAMALQVSSLWGYIWHDTDIRKMLYLTVDDDRFITNQSVLFYYHVPVIFLVTYGMYYSRAVVFNKSSALKLATVVSVMAAPLYCVQTMLLTCETGLMQSLGTEYQQPSCSSNCQCTFPYSGFSPVCVSDTLTTYMSPCHAGCTGEDIIGGLKVYRNCSCAMPGGRQLATVGACSNVQCRSEYVLHKVITPIIVLLVLLALQAQLVTLLRLVRPQDRHVAVGASTAAAFFMAFGFTHSTFFGVRAWLCAWFEGNQCQLYKPVFLQIIGGVSTGLAAVSAIITLVIFIIIRRRTLSEAEGLPMTETESDDTSDNQNR